MLMAVWMTVGYQMVVFLAGLQALLQELYESAMLDGASAWQQLEMGYAGAVSGVRFAPLMAVTWLQFRYLGRRIE